MSFHMHSFAQRPRKVFSLLKTEEFANRFMGTIQAPSHVHQTFGTVGMLKYNVIWIDDIHELYLRERLHQS